jgi:hypothetical protein
MLSGLNIPFNIVAAQCVKYTENMFCKIFCLTQNAILNKNTHNCFTFLEINSPNRIGGAHHRISVEKIEIKSVSPYIVSAPHDYSNFIMCEFIEHLEMSKALTQYDNSIYVICDVLLTLLANKAEHNSESPVSIYEFTRENTHKYHTHESQVPMSMGFQGSKY